MKRENFTPKDTISNALLLQWEMQEKKLCGDNTQPPSFIAYLLTKERREFWLTHAKSLANLRKQITDLNKKYFVHLHDFKNNTDAMQFVEPIVGANGEKDPNAKRIPKLNEGMTMVDYQKEMNVLMSSGIVI